MAEFFRNPTKVTAHQVTTDNIHQVAKWCNGSVRGVKLPAEDQVIEIWNAVTQLDRASVGDWIVKDGPYWFIYNDAIFQTLYNPAPAFGLGALYDH